MFRDHKGEFVTALTFVGIGTAAFLGFRIWEIADAWSVPSSQISVANVLRDQKQKLAFIPIVTPSFAGFTLLF
ncbi:MAG: hypothetical protein O2897_05000 [bacterium]|nr:hypothetical protein [bacterium]